VILRYKHNLISATLAKKTSEIYALPQKSTVVHTTFSLTTPNKMIPTNFFMWYKIKA